MTGTEEGAVGEMGDGCASESMPGEMPRHDIRDMMCVRKKGGCTSYRGLYLLCCFRLSLLVLLCCYVLVNCTVLYSADTYVSLLLSPSVLACLLGKRMHTK